MDAFATNYPGCTELQNTLTISGTDISDLMPLNTLIAGKNLSIVNNPLLTELNGLQNYRLNGQFSSSSLIINNNAQLIDISALTNFNVNNVFTGFSITNNPMLLSLEGLESFTSIDLSVVNNNDALINLTGLENVVCLCDGYLEISDNDNLINFEGLSSLLSMEFRVLNNSSLQNFSGLTSFTSGYLQIENNSSLLNFNGLESLTAAGLIINNNVMLSDISSLNNVDPNFFFGINITNNTSLSLCNTNFVCTALSSCSAINGCFNVIENNAEGCGSISEVSYACDLVPSNDDCEGATTLIIGETLEAYNEFATLSTQIPSCNDEDRADVWFTVNSGAFTSLDIITEAGYSLQLWEGDCASLTQVANACAEESLNDIPVTTNTDYYVQVWSCASCRMATGLFDILVQDGTLTTQAFAFEGFSLYPNPVSDVLYFKNTTLIDSVSVFNLLGQKVRVLKPNSVYADLDMASMPSGIYLVKVRIGGEEETYKVVKE